MLQNALVLLSVNKISSIKDLMPALELAKNMQLIIIAKDVEGEALSTLVLNRTKNKMKICAVKAPEYGSVNQFGILKDIATATGATLFGAEEFPDSDLENIQMSDFGKVSTDASLLVFY
jgi:chaperonin GroEL